MHVIYEIESTRLVRIIRNGYWQDARYQTEGAAKAAFTRLAAKGKVSSETHAVAPASAFHSKIEKQVTRRNLMSGEEFTQPINTPASCDPSSETYWSM